MRTLKKNLWRRVSYVHSIWFFTFSNCKWSWKPKTRKSSSSKRVVELETLRAKLIEVHSISIHSLKEKFFLLENSVIYTPIPPCVPNKIVSFIYNYIPSVIDKPKCSLEEVTSFFLLFLHFFLLMIFSLGSILLFPLGMIFFGRNKSRKKRRIKASPYFPSYSNTYNPFSFYIAPLKVRLVWVLKDELLLRMGLSQVHSLYCRGIGT